MPAARVDKVPGHRGGATSLGRHAMMQGRRCRACERALDHSLAPVRTFPDTSLPALSAQVLQLAAPARALQQDRLPKA